MTSKYKERTLNQQQLDKYVTKSATKKNLADKSKIPALRSAACVQVTCICIYFRYISAFAASSFESPSLKSSLIFLVPPSPKSRILCSVEQPVLDNLVSNAFSAFLWFLLARLFFRRQPFLLLLSSHPCLTCSNLNLLGRPGHGCNTRRRGRCGCPR